MGKLDWATFKAGFLRLRHCKTVTRDMSDWTADAAWMTPYFSLCVWSSIWLSIAPRPAVTERSRSGRLTASLLSPSKHDHLSAAAGGTPYEASFVKRSAYTGGRGTSTAMGGFS